VDKRGRIGDNWWHDQVYGETGEKARGPGVLIETYNSVGMKSRANI
jgi:hypothetical protein